MTCAVTKNIGYICTAQQVLNGYAEKQALRWIETDGSFVDYTFDDLHKQTNCFAHSLRLIGLEPGEILFTFLPKMPEQYIAFLGALKCAAITGTLFSSFGDEALMDRLGASGAKAIVTKKSLYKKIARIRHKLPHLTYVILVDGESDHRLGIYSYTEMMTMGSVDFEAVPVNEVTPSVLHYTSGSTGKPKGVLHCHGSVVSQRFTAQSVLGLMDNDVYWCTADHGWVTGTSYGIIGPWSLGITQIQYAGGYDARSWFNILSEHKVTIWYSAPTALRMLMREEKTELRSYDLSSLRSIFSVGEPLNPEVIAWSRTVLNHAIYDTWFQTETGAIMIANRPGLEVHPGSMGKPINGVEVAILNDEGEVLPPDEQGYLCLKPDWPSMFIQYLNNPSAYQARFKHGWYFTGDTAQCDEEGYVWFLGRSDDVINTAGHLISPFEVESALLEMDEVAESGVVGVPDDLLFEKVVAYIHLNTGQQATIQLEIKIRLHVSNRVSTIATPQEIVFCESIPKNMSGKIMRRVLKARYLGLDEGDVSTMEGSL